MERLFYKYFILISIIILTQLSFCQAEKVKVDFEDGFVKSQAPYFNVPEYKGSYSEALVPDTLDLAEMATLSLNGLTGPTDSANGYELYFVANWFTNPPKMYHEFGSECKSKFMGPLVLNRIISGSYLGIETERKMIEYYLRGIDDNGLYHAPIRGRPWHLHGWDMQSLQSWISGNSEQTSIESSWENNLKEPAYGGGHLNPRLIEAMLLYYQRDNSPMWINIIENMIRNGTSNFVDNNSWGYFGAKDKVPKGFLAADGWMPQSLAQYYRITGSKKAKELAGKLCYFLKDHANYFNPDGSFIGDPNFFNAEKAKYGGHFHNHTNDLIAMLEYAYPADDAELVKFVQKSFEWAKSKKAFSSELIGFFPELVHPKHPNSEGCAIADMLALAVMLSNHKDYDYWDEADRWLRNMFAESQLTPEIGQKLDKLSASLEKTPTPYHAVTERVTQRNIGAFAGWPKVNDWADHIGIMHCCTGNGTRTIYYVWENILQSEGDILKVNMLVNRYSKYADVFSFIPYKGEVNINVKKATKLFVRMPQWLKDCGSIKVAVDSNNISISQKGRYIDCGKIQQGSLVNITFPIEESVVKETIAETEYTFKIKGTTVVDVSPKSDKCPLFERSYYRSDCVRWKKIRCFVSDEQIQWCPYKTGFFSNLNN